MDVLNLFNRVNIADLLSLKEDGLQDIVVVFEILLADLIHGDSVFKSIKEMDVSFNRVLDISFC